MAIAGPSRRHFMGRAGCKPSETFSQASNGLWTVHAETDWELRCYKVQDKRESFLWLVWTSSWDKNRLYTNNFSECPKLEKRSQKYLWHSVEISWFSSILNSAVLLESFSSSCLILRRKLLRRDMQNPEKSSGRTNNTFQNCQVLQKRMYLIKAITHIHKARLARVPVLPLATHSQSRQHKKSQPRWKWNDIALRRKWHMRKAFLHLILPLKSHYFYCYEFQNFYTQFFVTRKLFSLSKFVHFSHFFFA